ncbi:sialidase family protein [Nocardioides terrae]|uniref:sialidase family protein n=1 Tax=Nocardioides terrae TaxID=574651 RepID=UPI0011138280|nr:sialidase family protein [Nocardioides terrae]
MTPSPAGAAPFNVKHLNKIQSRLISGELLAELGDAGVRGNLVPGGGDEDQDHGADGAANTPPDSIGPTVGRGGLPDTYAPAGSGACSERLGSNVKVNQNCLNVSDPDLQGRGQANNESFISQDPFNRNHIIASDNDYVRGDGTCGAAYSLDRGRTWNDSTVPNSFTRGQGANARQYWQAGGDTSVAWDTRGNAYLSCQLFNRGTVASSDPDQSSSFVVFRSTGNNGASWNFPGRYTAASFDPAGAAGVLEDKELMTVDASLSSPFRDRVYITWTEFAADGTAYIYETHSSDYGETFSPRVLVSSDSAMCPTTFGVPTPQGRCNENQYSDPFTGPDGALYVAWSNFNNAVTGTDNRNQVLLAKSTDGGTTFSAPVKVSDYYDLPDCDTYQGDGADPGRACVPEKGTSTKSVFRATNYPSGAVNPTRPNQVVVTFGSYINRHSNESRGCTPAGFADSGQDAYTGVKTGGCNNDILASVSDNGGASFTGTTTDPRAQTSVTQERRQGDTDQFWQWVAFSSSGTLAVDYYDRQYGSDETTGYSDISLSGSRDLARFGADRVTTSSMPPPTQFPGPNGGQFYGDYTGLTVTNEEAHPVWSDTRAVDVFLCPDSATGAGDPPRLCTATETNGLHANDQEMFTDSVRIPKAHR